jgi:colicin import membrane protein
VRVSTSEPGIAVSGAAHAALLLAIVLAFADAKKFDDAQESVAVEVITDSQFNDIVKGEKTAPAVVPQAKSRAERVADITDTKPSPPLAEADREVQPPLSVRPDLTADHAPDVAKPVAAPPPTPVQAAEPPELPKRAVEAVKPEALEPPPRPPQVQPETEQKPVPDRPKRVRPTDKQVVDNPLEQVTKLLEQKKLEEIAKAEAKPAKPKPADEPIPRKYDVSAIAKLISHEAPQQTASTARDLNRVASLGAANANAAKMSPSLMGELDEYMIDQYKRCWNPVGVDTGRYMPKISVRYNLDGSLASEPRLLNPTADPAARALADSALRAIHICNPLNIPARFQPFYQEWKDRTLSFNPEDFL